MLGKFQIPILFSYASAENECIRMSSAEKTFLLSGSSWSAAQQLDLVYPEVISTSVMCKLLRKSEIHVIWFQGVWDE